MITFIDLEVDKKTKHVYDFGAVNDKGKEVHTADAKKFIKLCSGSDFYCGHNIVAHDLLFINDLQYRGMNFDSNKIIDTLLLSSLLFPNKPYHSLIKEDKLKPEDSNNPLNDSKNAMKLFYDEVEKFNSLSIEMKSIYYKLLRKEKGFEGFFRYLNFEPIEIKITELIRTCFEDMICSNSDLEDLILYHKIELAYTLALINTNNVTSLFPEWIIRTYPYVETCMIVLRGTPCEQGCSYCNKELNGSLGLKRFFGYEKFRDFDGQPLQEKAVKHALRNESLLAVFPTGGGKSITFQVPALMRGEMTRSLTVVISPLQSLMKDQVDNLESKNITASATINGLLDPIERQKEIERVKNGDVSILYVSPEALRSTTIEKVLMGRDITRFVIDEAHCFSSWGQDFRVDYLYIGDFIKNIQDKKNNKKQIPISCFTATAKKQVIRDIKDYFKNKLGVDMIDIISTSQRSNLSYSVIAVDDENKKYAKLRELIDLHAEPIIVYTSRTKLVDELCEKLKIDGYNVSKFHGKMEKDEKIAEQNAFMNDQSQIMVATSAFGMGVDKSNVGAVIHFNISDSIENYVQEAGRAGRDEKLHAVCYVLYHKEDLDEHFALLNSTKVYQKEIYQIWQGIKRLTGKRNEITKSALEIARASGWDDSGSDVETRVKTSIATLEDSGYVKRGQNVARVFASSLIVRNAEEARKKIINSKLFETEIEVMNAERVVSRLLTDYHTKGQSTENETRMDYLADQLGLDNNTVIHIVQKLKEAKILEDFKDIVCYLEKKTELNSASKIEDKFAKLENYIIPLLIGDEKMINLKMLNEKAIENGIKSTIKDIKDIINYLAITKRIKVKKEGSDVLRIHTYQENILDDLQFYHDIAGLFIEFLYNHPINKGNNTTSEIISVYFSIMDVKDYINKNKGMFRTENYTTKDVEETMYYLKRIGALKIEGGFLVTYSPMRITRTEIDNKKVYTKADYEKLNHYYETRAQQIHIVGEYAEKMTKDYRAALSFVDDYFQLEYTDFLNKYFVGERKKDITRNMSKEKFQELFGELSPQQLSIIQDKDSQQIVVGAGPGSGKTKLLVHKLASIVMTEDIRTEQLLMLTFSRAAASEFKSRLIDLIGSTAYYIDIKTFHSYAFDLLGQIGNIEKTTNVIKEATELIKNHEADLTKITKMVLVLDEAQDISEEEYELITTLMDYNPDLRVIAVGDDDQNIYEFRGSSSLYMKSFVDEGAKLYELLINYRSKRNIVDYSNYFVRMLKNRIKESQIKSKSEIGGKIKIVKHTNESPAYDSVVFDFFNSNLEGTTAILTRDNNEASIIYGLLGLHGVNAKLIQNIDSFSIEKMIEFRDLLSTLYKHNTTPIINKDKLTEVVDEFTNSHKSQYTELAIKVLYQFLSLNNMPFLSDFEEFIRESKLEDFVEKNVVYVSTLHKAKGKEFDNGIIYYNNKSFLKEDELRLLYVGMTRAKTNLFIHTTHNIFQSYSEVDVITDDTVYEQPKRLLYQLSHRDVQLGYFKYTEKAVKNIYSGAKLHLEEDIVCNQYNHKILKFSNKYKAELSELLLKGYQIKEITANYMVYWFDKENEEGYYIVLPEIIFEKNS
ncbi:MAG: RecQ family ATP-dependent DNA helicase [Acholeplasmataceae bacterium]